MIIDIFVYLTIFAICIFAISLFQKIHNQVKIVGISNRRKIANNLLYSTLGCICIFPVIAMFGLRYGIGTDYFNYEFAYNSIHNATFKQYWDLHNRHVGYFYVEPGYYVLNKIFPSFRFMLWGIGILLFILFFASVKDYSKRFNYSFALFIYLATQYIYSLNSMRFSIALCFLLVGYVSLSHDKTSQFVVMVLLASLFHQSCFFCLGMFVLKRYKCKEVNNIRDIVLFAMILFFPVLSRYLLKIIEKISLFERYFSTSMYSASETMSGGWMWLLHIVPVIFPLLVFCRKEIFDAEDTGTLFRICIMEIPFRMLGLYNTWYTRFARCSQIAQVIFITLVLSKIQNKQNKSFLYIYFIVWFLFYFAYYAIVNDQGDSLPYVWIFTR